MDTITENLELLTPFQAKLIQQARKGEVQLLSNQWLHNGEIYFKNYFYAEGIKLIGAGVASFQRLLSQGMLSVGDTSGYQAWSEVGTREFAMKVTERGSKALGQYFTWLDEQRNGTPRRDPRGRPATRTDEWGVYDRSRHALRRAAQKDDVPVVKVEQTLKTPITQVQPVEIMKSNRAFLLLNAAVEQLQVQGWEIRLDLTYRSHK